ncbi:zinc-ribbon and DUF3426 domain-containing protein [Burkholderiaceae bacterium UC74_6]
MSLATRCTACGTIFRVVQDQLRVSEGWVRCGRCAEVFDARQQLFDIEREAPPPWPATATAPAHPGLDREDDHARRIEAARVQEESSFEHIDLPEEQEAPLRDERTQPLVHDEPLGEASQHARFEDRAYDEPRWVDEPEAAPAPEPALRAEPTATLPEVPTDMGDDVVLAPNLQAQAEAPEAGKKPKSKRGAKIDTGSKAVAEQAPAAPPIPSFMRRAQAKERWSQPKVRLALGVAAGLLTVVLGAQFALHFRDALAAQYPSTRPLLTSLCSMQGCEIQPWRHIDVLSVENTGLAQAGAGNQYQLTVSLLNRGSVAVALPWIQLSLSDAQGAVIARRALSPKDFHTDKGAAVGTSINGGTDLNLQVLLATGDQRVTGYDVVLFYP